MKKQKEFYIGWQEEMPNQTGRFLKRVIVLLFVLLPVLVAGVVLLQKPFNAHQFEFGNLRSITGTYYSAPLPVLVADEGQLPDTVSSNLLLVGYGKFGAEGIMKQLESENGPLSGKKITLSGTLIYGDGKSLLELTEEEGALSGISGEGLSISRPERTAETRSLSGEVVDPKCYFGVMKPGEGKVHKSCAIRCISGGIPPVLRTVDASGEYRYYLILGREGQAVNREILPYVAEQVRMEGNTGYFQGWDLVYVNPEEIKLLNE